MVDTYRGETLSTSESQVRADTVVATPVESWRVNERRPATQASRSSRVSSRPQVSKSFEQQLAAAHASPVEPDTNNLLNPLQVQAHMSLVRFCLLEQTYVGGYWCLLGEGHMVTNLQQRKQPVTS